MLFSLAFIAETTHKQLNISNIYNPSISIF